MELLRNLGRRRLRNSLTIAGIVIGVVALTTMGGLAEMINSLVEGGVSFYSDHVTVTSKGGLIQLQDIAAIQSVQGVDAAIPMVLVPAVADNSGFNLVNSQIVAFGPGYADHEHFKLTYSQGNEPKNPGEVSLGTAFARQLNARVGESITLPVAPKQTLNSYVPHTFKVVGLMNRTLTQPDYWAVVVMADGQMLLGDVLPPAIRSSVDPTRLATEVDVFARSGVNLDRLADVINRQVTNVQAQGPAQVIDGLRSTEVAFTLIATAAAVIALVIGGLSVINTMIVAVAERVREIGVKKALGAHRRDILLEYLGEAALIGLLGGVVGLGLGYAITAVLNATVGGQATSLFLITPRLAAIAVGFAVILASLAGTVPAYRAARLDPVAALRSR